MDDLAQVEAVLAEGFRVPGPTVIEAIVDPNEPALPGHATMRQAWNFAKSLVRGEKDRSDIVKTLLEDKVREVV